jgi:hypothetical protein
MFVSKQEQLMFQPITTLIESLLPKFNEKKENHLPCATQLNQYINATNLNNKPLQFISQDESLPFKNLGYEQRIYLHGLIATRNHNWHDFFNALAWLSFPKTKVQLNFIHFKEQSKQNDSLRSARRDLLTLFDECGVIIQAEDSIHQLIRDHQWHELFVTCKNLWRSGEIKITTFGHAMYEKYMFPYIGMTAKALLLPKDNVECDKFISSKIANDELLINKGELFPLPVLGIPGWHKIQDENFYANQNYFRP